MPLQIIKEDIAKIKADAIVSCSDNWLSGSGGVDALIREKAGKQLSDVLNAYGQLETGRAIITSAFEMKNCRYIIHTVGPVFDEMNDMAQTELYDAYHNSLVLAKENDLESLAFPLIASGTFNWPKGEALRIATKAIKDFLNDNEIMVYLLVYDKEAFDTSCSLYQGVVDALANLDIETTGHISEFRKNSFFDEVKSSAAPIFMKTEYLEAEDDYVLDESFSQCLLRMIDERNLRDQDVYKAANMDRRLFSKIRSDEYYSPKKETAVSLAIALKLDLNETNELLSKAGYVLSSSLKFDVIIKEAIKQNNYDIFAINEVLFNMDQKTLGC